MQSYDSDRQFPLFGFGGIPRFTGASQVSHCFNLNGSPNPEVHGLEGIHETYKRALAGTELYGPTFFAPILRTVVDHVRAGQAEPMYHIFLILTDGEIHDMPQTVDLVVEASSLPLSIIIVGVGNESFRKMVELDADEQILRNGVGKPAERDIVQFVKFADYRNSHISVLAEEVLKEVPEQFVGYMMSRGIRPPPPVAAPDFNQFV